MLLLLIYRVWEVSDACVFLLFMFDLGSSCRRTQWAYCTSKEKVTFVENYHLLRPLFIRFY